MRQITSALIVVPEQKWKNVYLEITFNLQGGEYYKLLFSR